MAQALDENTTSVGIKRLGRPAAVAVDELGPLASLAGTWIGSRGWELIAVPRADSFRLIVRPYVEVITFSSLGAPVPNRGGPVPDLFITGLMYSTRITDAETNEPLHLETGMWLNLGDSQPQPLARLASIPHGDSVMALGTSTTTSAAPVIPSSSAVPNPGPEPFPGYTEPYTLGVFTFNGVTFDTQDVQKVLRDVVSQQTVVETTTLDVSTANDGGIVNIPFVDKEANATAFSSTFWIETIEDPKTNDQTMQLQYAQQTNIEFLPQFGNPSELILWPHVNVNTLVKQ